MSPRIGLTLDTILHAATEIADEQGLAEVTLANLAKKLKIRPPSLYNHIDGLKGLRKLLAIYGLEKLYNELMEAAVGYSGDEAVRAIGVAYVDFARTHPGLYEATLHAPDPQEEEVKKAGNKIVELTVKVLSVYGLEEEASLHAIRGLRSILHGFASLEQSQGFGLPLDLDETLRRLIDTFLAGIHVMK